jgi:membrane protein implicated in regulation of membrane protease activity
MSGASVSPVFNLYVAALVAALGAFAIQFFSGGHDAGGGGGHDAGGGGHDASHDDGGNQAHEASAWSLVASVRFWSFALLAFGIVGTSLTLLQLAGPTLTTVLAAGSGLGSGFFAASVIRRLSSRPASSHAGTKDVVGRVGRVIVPLVPGGLGKVRVEVKGAEVDYTARSSETVEAGEAVIVEESAEGEVVVSRAPKELGK